MGFFPYVDVTLYPLFKLKSVKLKTFTLGFIVANNLNQPSWGGYYSINSNHYMNEIKSIQDIGGNIIISFGGQLGRDLATVTNNANDLFSLYDQVINKYNINSIDFDIEGDSLYNKKANQRRSDAIELLIKKHPKLKVSCTVPVSPHGLEPHVIDLIKSTPCNLVNIMAMDYGNGYNRMGELAITAAIASRKQTSKNIGITVMIGQNDVQGEIFTLDDARNLKKFASNTSWVKRLSIWSLNRDKNDGGDLSHSSQINQKPFQFTDILK